MSELKDEPIFIESIPQYHDFLATNKLDNTPWRYQVYTLARLPLRKEIYILEQKLAESEKYNFALSAYQCIHPEEIDIEEGVDAPFCSLKIKLSTTQKALDEAREVIGFYGNPESWMKKDSRSWSQVSPKSHGDSEIIKNYEHPNKDWRGAVTVGGKRAREWMKKHKSNDIKEHQCRYGHCLKCGKPENLLNDICQLCFQEPEGEK